MPDGSCCRLPFAIQLHAETRAEKNVNTSDCCDAGAPHPPPPRRDANTTDSATDTAVRVHTHRLNLHCEDPSNPLGDVCTQTMQHAPKTC
jgi:hypothetical protein